MIIHWPDIDTVLLDMDGTLLDRHFDDHFWLDHVPATYARKHGLPLPEARAMLHALFRSQERTLNWTDLDFWSERLGLDIPLLKREVDHLIAVHPHVVEFLQFLRHQRKQVHLVTNAHSKTLDLKMRKTRLGGHFDRIISAHDLGLPKEDPAFWPALQRVIPYSPARTMLGEDSEVNLGTAQQYGIGYLIYVSRFSSAVMPVPSDHFTSIHYFSELIPRQGNLTVHLPGQQQ
jgi:putative hydrolase of the HAD superfamily